MFWHALLLFAIIVTVARARQQGVPWLDIVATPSQWLHYAIFGGPWGHTMCSCTGLHVRDGHRNKRGWLALQTVFDLTFCWIERHHCAESLWRVEKEQRKNGHHFPSQ